MPKGTGRKPRKCVLTRRERRALKRRMLDGAGLVAWIQRGLGFRAKGYGAANGRSVAQVQESIAARRLRGGVSTESGRAR